MDIYPKKIYASPRAEIVTLDEKDVIATSDVGAQWKWGDDALDNEFAAGYKDEY